jgi:DMSO/TMAO reductase YedYZ molybdopterin-dependent catalytic subunit
MIDDLRRRTVLRGAVASAALLQGRGFAQVGPNDKVIPWNDQPPPVPPPFASMAKGLTPWEELNSWITSNNKFFSMARYERPVVDERSWRLDIDGLVAKPLTFTLAELKSLPRREVICTIECSGSNGLPFVTSAIGNARWVGASLSETLIRAQN